MSCLRRIALLLFLSVPAFGQVEYDHQLIESPHVQAFAQFGATIVVRDLNADGFGDVIVCEPNAPVAGKPYAGRAYVFWGPTLAVSKSIVSRQAVPYERLGYGYHFGPSATVADVDGDGSLDLVLPALGWNSSGVQSDFVGRVHVFLGPDWVEELILTEPTPTSPALFGESILIRDLDGDGLNEVLVGAPRAGGVTSGLAEEGRIWIWRGTDLAAGVVTAPELLENPAPVALAWFGYAVRTADFNGDGVEDFWVAASEAPGVLGIPGAGRLHVLDGITRSPISLIEGPVGLRRFGDLRYKGDLTGDGIDDIVVSAPRSIFKVSATVNVADAGAMVILQGPDYTVPWKILWSPNPIKESYFGVKSHVVDFNADGALDIVVGDAGTTFNEGNRLWVFFGPDFEVYQNLEDPSGAPHSVFGKEVATGDIDGDGIPEILGGANEVAGQGSVQIFSLRTLTADSTEVSVSQGGDVHLDLRLGGAKAGHAYVGALSLSGSGAGVVLGKGSWLPLMPDVMSAMGLALIGTPILPDFKGVLDSDGAASLTIHWPAGFAPSFAGSELTVAVLTSADGKRPGAGSSAVTIKLLP